VSVVDDVGCIGSDTLIVTVTLPLKVTDLFTQICRGESVILGTNVSDGSGGYSYLWDSGAITSTITVAPTTTSSYVLTVSDTCMSVDANIQVQVDPGPIVDFTPLCDPDPYILRFINNSSPLTGSTFLWSFGDSMSSTLEEPSHTFAGTGTYDVTLSVTSAGGCSNDTTISVIAPPQASFSENPTEASIENPEIHFTDLSLDSANIVIWEWDFGDGSGIDNLAGQAGSNAILTPSNFTTGTYQNPRHLYADTGHFFIQLTVRDINNCIDTITRDVRIFNEYFLYAPSAFSPNGDNKNEAFMPQGLGINPQDFHMSIYNRWGDIIFETDNINEGWDGRANDGTRPAQTEVYVWTISARDIRLKIHQYIGHVTLLR